MEVGLEIGISCLTWPTYFIYHTLSTRLNDASTYKTSSALPSYSLQIEI